MSCTSGRNSLTPAGRLRIDVFPSPPHDAARPAVIAVHGEIDVSNADEVCAAATALFAEQADVVIDLRAVGFMALRTTWLVSDLPETATRLKVRCVVVTSPAVDHVVAIANRCGRRAALVSDAIA